MHGKQGENQMYEYLKSIPITISVAGLAILAFCIPDLALLFDYNTTSSIITQPIQLLGCHLLHWSGDHLFWDLGMFTVLGSICERLNRKAFAIVMLASAILIPPTVGLFYPAIETYRGLSGLDTALFGMATLSFIVERLGDRDTTGVAVYTVLLIGMFLKIGHELLHGNTFFVESNNFQPVPIAHVVGAIVGLAAAGWTTWSSLVKLSQPTSSTRVSSE